MSQETIIAYSAIVQAAAAAVSLVVAGVLAYITYQYMKLTRGILDETSKARKANEDSARAAVDSVRLMRQQLEEQAGLGKFSVERTIDSVVNEIELILKIDLTRPDEVRSLPGTESLLPQQPEPAVSHAAKFSTKAAGELSKAFDDLRIGRSLLVDLTTWSRTPPVEINSFAPFARNTRDGLKLALSGFLAARRTLSGAAGRPRPGADPETEKH